MKNCSVLASPGINTSLGCASPRDILPGIVQEVSETLASRATSIFNFFQCTYLLS
ncbi:MAG: hypothetical protein OSB11_03210 [Gammaproteobacteria bacterium]|nr:hypothetical protein [Gammaproteobacteria bacterium]